MGRSIGRGLDSLIDHCAVACVFLALFTLTWLSTGYGQMSALLGLSLCIVGLTQRTAQVDLWIFLPLVGYELIGMISTFVTYGDITSGYAMLQLILPVLYLLMACLSQDDLRLLKQLCAVWAGGVALYGIVRFVFRAVAQGRTVRLYSVLSNPNGAGIFLVVGWFLLIHCVSEAEGRWAAFLPHIEPLILIALALTLSMGSFVSMAAGILVLTVLEKRRSSGRGAFQFACRLLAKASLGIGTGILLYLGASRSGSSGVCLPLSIYAAALVLYWDQVDSFMDAKPGVASVIAAFGFAVAAAAVFLRPSSIDTFAERLAMMRNALHYLTANPLLGVGPFQWRILNMADSDTYFNVWHIHNSLLHVGVEYGWIAMAMLVTAVVRAFRKKSDSPTKGGLTAFCVHSLIDTGFFYTGTTSLVLAAGNPRDGGRTVSGPVLKAMFGMCAALYAFDLCLLAAVR